MIQKADTAHTDSRGTTASCATQPETCSRQPLVLVFDSAHFMPLVASDLSAAELEAAAGGTGSTPVLVPLLNGEYEDLPLRFKLEGEAVTPEQRAELVRCSSPLLAQWERDDAAAHEHQSSLP